MIPLVIEFHKEVHVANGVAVAFLPHFIFDWDFENSPSCSKPQALRKFLRVVSSRNPTTDYEFSSQSEVLVIRPVPFLQSLLIARPD